MWKIVKKNPTKIRNTSIQKRINVLGDKLNEMDDWRYKVKGRNFR